MLEDKVVGIAKSEIMKGDKPVEAIKSEIMKENKLGRQGQLRAKS